MFEHLGGCYCSSTSLLSFPSRSTRKRLPYSDCVATVNNTCNHVAVRMLDSHMC
jgi:hypothetical protein